MNYVFGEVASTPRTDTSFPPSRRQVLLHDHAGTGFPTWVPLMDGSTPRGLCSFDGTALIITSGHEHYGGTNAQYYNPLVTSRLTRPGGFNKLYVEWEWSARVYVYYTAGAKWTGVKGWSLGIDTSDGVAGAQPADSNRTLAFPRCVNYDEGTATLHSGAWQLTTGDAAAPGFTYLTNAAGQTISPVTAGMGALAVGLNYGKVLRQYTEQVFDLSGGGVAGATTAVLEGLRHNGKGFGSLLDGVGYDPNIATNPEADSLKATVPAQCLDGQFQNGLNLMAQIDNRSTTDSKNTLCIYRVRAVAF